MVMVGVPPESLQRACVVSMQSIADGCRTGQQGATAITPRQRVPWRVSAVSVVFQGVAGRFKAG
jgi:hypothetical protein